MRFSAVAALLLFCSESALSCSYTGGLPEYMDLPWPERIPYYADNAEVIFRGRVVSIETFDGRPATSTFRVVKRAEIAVSKVWKGDMTPKVSYRGSTSCDPDLALNIDLVFFGKVVDGYVALSGLTGTAPLAIEKYLGPPLKTFDEGAITVQ